MAGFGVALVACCACIATVEVWRSSWRPRRAGRAVRWSSSWGPIELEFAVELRRDAKVDAWLRNAQRSTQGDWPGRCASLPVVPRTMIAATHREGNASEREHAAHVSPDERQARPLARKSQNRPAQAGDDLSPINLEQTWCTGPQLRHATSKFSITTGQSHTGSKRGTNTVLDGRRRACQSPYDSTRNLLDGSDDLSTGGCAITSQRSTRSGRSGQAAVGRSSRYTLARPWTRRRPRSMTWACAPPLGLEPRTLRLTAECSAS